MKVLEQGDNEQKGYKYDRENHGNGEVAGRSIQMHFEESHTTFVLHHSL
jgi:hypothetical protein